MQAVSEILVKTNIMTQCVNSERDITNKLNNLAREIESVQRRLRFNVKSRAKIDSQLSSLIRVTQRNSEHMTSLSNVLSNAVGTYYVAEKRIEENATGATVASSKSSSSESTKSDSDSAWKWTWNDTWKLVGSVGIVGSVVSTIGSIITGGDTWSTDSLKMVLSTGKNIAKVVEKVAGASGSNFDWKKLFGFNLTDASSNSFFSALKDQGSQYKFGNATTVADKVKVGAKWAGVALTGAIKAYENFTDTTENNFWGRRLAETIGETAVTVGEGILISAAVGAVCAGAPAVVVGGITVVTTWAVDKAFEAITGKDTAEFISDTVLDAGEKIIEGASNIAKSVGNTAQKAAGNVTAWWKKHWDKLDRFVI